MAVAYFIRDASKEKFGFNPLKKNSNREKNPMERSRFSSKNCFVSPIHYEEFSAMESGVYT
ncbi:hypothetical protein SADUNF_Sadunf06G0066000 [Salix dunnii]|uniref:Uncharacterized protein n=1 Tax=Salix dunnii TaxID=1413687 RepID=A0A835JXY6_9ROSI|nr:hypothetical protein SADUNF_Sadunf06G0066000 [Salix dunnii]